MKKIGFIGLGYLGKTQLRDGSSLREKSLLSGTGPLRREGVYRRNWRTARNRWRNSRMSSF